MQDLRLGVRVQAGTESEAGKSTVETKKNKVQP